MGTLLLSWCFISGVSPGRKSTGVIELAGRDFPSSFYLRGIAAREAGGLPSAAFGGAFFARIFGPISSVICGNEHTIFAISVTDPAAGKCGFRVLRVNKTAVARAR